MRRVDEMRHSGRGGCWACVAGLLLAALLAASLQGGALAQTPTPARDLQGWTATIGQFDASKYPDITIYMNVTNRQGDQVEGLQSGDFVVTEDGQPVTITNFAGLGENRPVDIVYVFDTTASMTEEIAGVVQTSLAFADELERKGRDYRLGLVTFADQVLVVQLPDLTLTADAAEFKRWVSALIANGGDLEPENDYAALRRALEFRFRPEAQVVCILITDAPPHKYGDPMDSGVAFDDPTLDLGHVLDATQAKGAAVYAIAPNLDAFRALAEQTGGRFYDIRQNPDFTGLIASLGRTLAHQYRITYRSPRPTYDGTRRNVQVRVGGALAGEVYAEQHLLTVSSNCWIGLLCLLPLLFSLAIPPLVRGGLRWAGVGAAPSAAQPARLTPAPTGGSGAPAGMEMSRDRKFCANCGQTLRPEARFCSRCGEPV